MSKIKIPEGQIDLEQLVGKGKPKADITVTINYSFMAPDKNVEKGIEYFNLCEYIESCMPDQIHRGLGKHSFLGFINEQRSDVMLYRNLTIDNMSRALTQESVLIAPYDIVHVLSAAKRPYAKDIAEIYGIADSFSPDSFQTSDKLNARIPFNPVPSLLIAAPIAAAAYRRRRHNRKQAEKHLKS